MTKTTKEVIAEKFHKTHSTVSIIIGYAQLLKSEVDQSKLEYLNKVIEAAKELNKNLTDLEDTIKSEK